MGFIVRLVQPGTAAEVYEAPFVQVDSALSALIDEARRYGLDFALAFLREAGSGDPLRVPWSEVQPYADEFHILAHALGGYMLTVAESLHVLFALAAVRGQSVAVVPSSEARQEAQEAQEAAVAPDAVLTMAIQAKDRLTKALVGKHPNVVGCGVSGAGPRWHLRLYVLTDDRTDLPEVFDGFPVVVETTGAVTAAPVVV